MTRRRIIEPGLVWALSRRTTRRHFILNPDEPRQVEQAYWYCLGHAAELHGVVVHAACLMSTHSHEVVTDVRADQNVPDLVLCPAAAPACAETLHPDGSYDLPAAVYANPAPPMGMRFNASNALFIPLQLRDGRTRRAVRRADRPWLSHGR